MYKKIFIDNFRGFKDFELDGLRRVNIIGGGNNVGKTTLLEALFIKAGETIAELTSRISILRGLDSYKISDTSVWGEIFRNFNIDNIIEISSTDINDSNETIKIAIGLRDIIHQTIDNGGKKGIYSSTPEQPIDQFELKYTFKKDHEEELEFYGFVGSQGIYYTRPTPRSANCIYLPSKLDINFENAKRLDDITEAGKKDIVISSLKNFDDRIIDIATIQRGEVSYIYVDIGLRKMVPIQIVGNGVSHILGLILALISVDKGYLIIDEIENGIHYSNFPYLWKQIDELSSENGIQIFITTHNFGIVKSGYRYFNDTSLDDFRYLRLDRVNGDIIPKVYPNNALENALETNFEVR